MHNVITATLTVRGGKIVHHHDDFSWDRWARQAFPLGPTSSWRPVKHVLQAGIRQVLKSQIAKRQKAARAAAASPAAPRNGIAEALPGR